MEVTTTAAKGNEDTAQPVWGQGFRPAAELPLGAELYVSAGRTGDLVAGQPVTLTTASSGACLLTRGAAKMNLQSL